MTDYISREAALNTVHNVPKGNWSNARYAHELQAVPAADVAPVVHAEWKINADGHYPYCSACRKKPPGRCMTAHCPNCGAVMDGGKKNAVN